MLAQCLGEHKSEVEAEDEGRLRSAQVVLRDSTYFSSSAIGGVRLVAASMIDWRAPNRMLVIQDSADHREAKVFRVQRKLGQRAEVPDEPAEGWRQSG